MPKSEINLEDLGVDFVNLVISRSDIESNDIKQSMNILNKLVESPDTIVRFQGSVNMSVHGYADDQRELYEIPEVRYYFQHLLHEFPYMFFFISTRFPTLKVMSFCVLRRRHRGNWEGKNSK